MAYIYNGVQQPISLQEYLTLPLMVKDAYDTAEKQYNDYQDKVAAIKAMSVGIPEAQSEIQAYEDSISDLSDYISNHRYDNKMRIASNNLRDQFRNRVIPISTNITALQKYMQDFSAKDDGTILGRKLGYRDFAENPLRQYQLIQGSAIRNEAAKMAAAASARRIQDLKESRVHGGQYFRTTQETGFSEDDVKNWESIPELSAIRDQLYKAYGSNDFNPAEMDKYIAEGIYLGATYNKQISDNANKNYGVSPSYGPRVDLSSMPLDELEQLYYYGTNNINQGTGLAPADRNLFKPNNSSDSNGNLIQSIDQGTGRVIIKSPIGMVAALGASIGSDKTEAINWGLEVLPHNHPTYKKLNVGSAWRGKNLTDDDYKAILEYTYLHHGKYGMRLKKEDEFSGSLFTGRKGHYKKILAQMKEAGMNTNKLYHSVDEFLQDLETSYNRNNTFNTNASTTLLSFNHDIKDIFGKITSDYHEVSNASYDENGHITIEKEALDDSDRNEIREEIMSNKASVAPYFMVSETASGKPNNKYIFDVRTSDGKLHTLVFSPEEVHNSSTAYDVGFNVHNVLSNRDKIVSSAKDELVKYRKNLQNLMSSNASKEDIDVAKQLVKTAEQKYREALLLGMKQNDDLNARFQLLDAGIANMSNYSGGINTVTQSNMQQVY